MSSDQRYLILALAGVVALIALLFSVRITPARDLGQWDAQDPSLREWYQSLMQPDAPTASCCGEADAYWCDDYYARGEKAYCRITDDREDVTRGRPHRENGTEFEIPGNKLKFDRSNPTGHAVVFLSRGGYVYCFVQGAGG